MVKKARPNIQVRAVPVKKSESIDKERETEDGGVGIYTYTCIIVFFVALRINYDR